MQNNRIASNKLAIAVALALSANSYASEEDNDVEVITVKGTKLETTLQENTASIEVYSPERLDQERIVDLNDLLNKTPNVNSSGSAGSFSIRGVGRSGVGNAGQGVTSNVYVDGAPLSGFALGRGPTPLWDVEQVEVLRGSQSSVQGRNALAGAIVVTTADPTYETEGKARFTYGSFGTMQAAGVINGALLEDQLAARLAVDYQERDGFVENVIAGRTNDFRESLAIRGKFLIEPNALPWFSTKLILDYNDSDLGESRPSVSTNLSTEQLAQSDFDFFAHQANGRFVTNTNDILRIVSDSRFELNDIWSVRLLFTKEETKVDRLFGLREDFDAFDGITFNQFDADIFSGELLFEFNYETFRGLFGIFYFEQEELFDRDIQVRLLPQIQNAVAGLAPQLVPLVTMTPDNSTVSLRDGETLTTENYAVFGQFDWDFSDNWTLNFGFRYDDEEFQQSDVFQETTVAPQNCTSTVPNAIVGNPQLGPLDSVTLPCDLLVGNFLGGAPVGPLNSADFNAFLPKISVTHHLSDAHSIFIGYQRGYRAGGSNIFTEPNPDGIGNIRVIGTYDPEYLDTIEVGARAVLLDDKLTANVNLFYSKYEDQQVTFTGDNPLDTADDRVLNAGESTIQGLELMLDYRMNDEWHLYSSIGLLEAEFDDFPFAADQESNFANLANNEFPNSPNVTMTIGANYTHPSGFYANINFSYVGEQWSAFDNLDNDDFRRAFEEAGLNGDMGAQFTEELDARHDLTLQMGYAIDDNFTIFAFGTNLLDSEELTQINYGAASQGTGSVVLSAPNTVFATVNPPRSFGVGVDYIF